MDSLDAMIERLERVSGLLADSPVLAEIRTELVRDLRNAGVPVADLVTITGLTRGRIYQLLEES